MAKLTASQRAFLNEMFIECELDKGDTYANNQFQIITRAGIEKFKPPKTSGSNTLWKGANAISLSSGQRVKCPVGRHQLPHLGPPHLKIAGRNIWWKWPKNARWPGAF